MPDSFHLDRIADFVGRDIGVSDWFTFDQGRTDFFGAATYDPDPQHDDPAWAAAHSPYGHTIAYGFQALSMLSHMTRASNLQPGGTGFALNYGFDRVRFVSPVPVNDRIRCHVHLPVPEYRMRLAGDDGTPVAPGEEGEVQIAGHFHFRAYFRRPGATAETFSPDG